MTKRQVKIGDRVRLRDKSGIVSEKEYPVISIDPIVVDMSTPGRTWTETVKLKEIVLDGEEQLGLQFNVKRVKPRRRRYKTKLS